MYLFSTNPPTSFNYEMLRDFYITLSKEGGYIDYIVVAQIFATVVILFQLGLTYYKSIQEKDAVAFTFDKIIRSVIVIMLIFSSVHLIDSIDEVFLAFEEYTMSEAQVISQVGTYDDIDNIANMSEEELTAEEMSPSTMDGLKELGLCLLDPSRIILKAVKWIFWVIDIGLFGVFIGGRFFMLLILKTIAPIAMIALAFFHLKRVQDAFYKWAMLLFATYMLIIPYLMVNSFASQLYHQFEKHLDDTLGVLNYVAGAAAPKNVALSIAFIVIVCLKISLYKKSYDIIHKVFN